MRDAQWKFGQASLAVKDTTVYCADDIKLGAIDSRAPFSAHKTGLVEGYQVVFSPDADFAAGDSFIPILLDSANGTDFTEILRGPQTAAAITKGTRARLPLPIEHRQYLRAGAVPKSTGTLTACTVTAWVEAGPN
jgi:hypothetical protein